MIKVIFYPRCDNIQFVREAEGGKSQNSISWSDVRPLSFIAENPIREVINKQSCTSQEDLI